MRVLLRLVATFAVIVAVLQVAGPTAAQASDPTLQVDRTGTAAGETMLVTGDGWSPGATLIVELCGHGGLRGTVDCDVSGQRTAGAGASGQFSVELTTGTPPTPCPCVIKATDQTSRISATAPISVAGIPTVPITEDDLPGERILEVSSIAITGGGRWAELFGAGGERVLEVTLVNIGRRAVEAPDVTVTWGSGRDPDGFVEPPETIGMEPGERQVLTVPLDRPTLTIGRQTAVVEVQGLTEPLIARASTSAYPWGLVASGLVLLQVLLLRIRNRVRRRLQRVAERASDEQRPNLDMGELAPGTPALPAAPDRVDDVDLPALVDLDDPALVGPPALSVHRTNGSTGNGSTLPVRGGVEAMEARLQLVALQLQARQVINRAVALSEAMVAAATSNAQELEAQSAQRLRAAMERHIESVEVLESAKARADEIIARAASLAAEALRDAASHQAGAHQALLEMRALHRQLADSASGAVDEVMRELDQQMACLGVGADRCDPADLAPPIALAPRLGGLDDRLARAVSLAFADSAMSATTTD